MSKFKFLIALFILNLIGLFCLKAQDDFSNRLLELQSELNIKSDSLIPQLNQVVDLDLTSAPVEEYLGIIADTYEMNISVSSKVSFLVSNRFADATIKDILFFLCKSNNLDMSFVSNIIYIFPFEKMAVANTSYREKSLSINYDTRSKTVDLDLNKDSLRLFTKQFTNKTGVNVIYDADLSNARVTIFMRDIQPEVALNQIAYANNFVLDKSDQEVYVFLKNQKEKRNLSVIAEEEEEGVFVDVRQLGADMLISINAKEVTIDELLEIVFEKTEQEKLISTVLDGNISVSIRDVTLENLLDLVFQNTTYTYQKMRNIYVIGEREQEGLRASKLLKLQYRSVKGIDEYIPVEFKKQVQISVFEELNALILSGSAPIIEEISLLIDKLDEPVPNVLIEVILIDVQKGYDLQTGFQFFLTDSVRSNKSTGRITPGLDIALGTHVVNNAMKNLGLAKLGQVTPSFYATLKAMEDANNIDIRSTPKLSTLNGHEASLKIGQSVYYVQRTQNINSGVAPVTTVSEQFKRVEANLSLLINPIVSGNSHITLEITAEFANFIPPEIENAPPGNATRKFTSMIRVEDEEMVLLGGLEELSKSSTSSGLPWLSRVPILSWLFSNKSKQTDKTKLIVFIKPTIVY